MYNQIYDLIVQYVYDNPEALTNFQELVATELATVFSVVTLSIPIFVVIWLLKWVISLIKI